MGRRYVRSTKSTSAKSHSTKIHWTKLPFDEKSLDEKGSTKSLSTKRPTTVIEIKIPSKVGIQISIKSDSIRDNGSHIKLKSKSIVIRSDSKNTSISFQWASNSMSQQIVWTWNIVRQWMAQKDGSSSGKQRKAKQPNGLIKKKRFFSFSFFFFFFFYFKNRNQTKPCKNAKSLRPLNINWNKKSNENQRIKRRQDNEKCVQVKCEIKHILLFLCTNHTQSSLCYISKKL